MTATEPPLQADDGDDGPRRPRRIFAHPLILAGCVVAAIALIMLIHNLGDPAIAALLIDQERSTFPFTVQNVMWIVFAIGVGEIIVRVRDAVAERSQLDKRYLPEDERTMLQGPDLRDIYIRARQAGLAGGEGQNRFLPRLIQRVVLQFQTSHSIDQANALLNSSLDLYLHEIDLRYSMIRYTVWVIPTLGFIGTVIGISLALAFAAGSDVQDPTMLAELTKRLAVAFNTTLLALVMSAVLVLMQHVVQSHEEGALNRAGQYCLDNLINRLYEEG